jgi:F-type H+-transporting ATPase subunit gamma
MASAKDLKKKIRTVTNTKKITRTMEMVATVKSKLGQNRIRAMTPYSTKLAEILASLAGSGSISHPLLGSGEGSRAARPSVLVVVTGNRGLCGGYNANVLRVAEDWLEEEEKKGRKAEVYMVGKKGVSRFRFLKIAVAKTFTHIKDLPSFKDTEEIADDLMRRFLAGEIDRVVIAATRYISASQHRPAEMQLLPIVGVAPEGEKEETAGARGAPEKAPPGKAGPAKSATVEFIFEPNREEILKALLPLSVKNAFYRILVEAAASEQIARRIAMKLATDNAEEIIKTYTRRYNRQRQAGITQQINEIVSGAEALD